jgi:hypothetical protein
MNKDEMRFQAAAMAMQGLLSNPNWMMRYENNGEFQVGQVYETDAEAVRQADMLLLELERTKPTTEESSPAPELLEVPWTCSKCGKETRNKHGYCDPCTGAKDTDAEGWIKHTPGDECPCQDIPKVDLKFRDGEIYKNKDPDCYEWGINQMGSSYEIIAWRPAK